MLFDLLPLIWTSSMQITFLYTLQLNCPRKKIIAQFTWAQSTFLNINISKSISENIWKIPKTTPVAECKHLKSWAPESYTYLKSHTYAPFLWYTYTMSLLISIGILAVLPIKEGFIHVTFDSTNINWFFLHHVLKLAPWKKELSSIFVLIFSSKAKI